MRNRKQTIAYLEKLQALGFTNEAFGKIHHFRKKARKETIQGHRAYCAKMKTDTFYDDQNNERVQIRLEMILRCFKEYHQKASTTKDIDKLFVRLADAVYVLVPPN